MDLGISCVCYMHRMLKNTNMLFKSLKIDYKSGFGGQFGVTKGMDKSAVGWDHIEKVEKHNSQKGS